MSSTINTVSHFRPNVPTLQRDHFYQQWQHLLQSQCVDAASSAIFYGEIEAYYRAPSRHYHDLAHIHDVLEAVERQREHAQNYEALQLAAWLHDVIYEIGVGLDNELDSANFAVEKLGGLGVSAEMLPTIHALILATRHRDIPADIDAKILIDADLLPLASPPEIFARNSLQIRAEYAIVPDEVFYPARKKVLQRFLDQDRIFLTDPIYEQYEAQARHNLREGIEQISDSIS